MAGKALWPGDSHWTQETSFLVQQAGCLGERDQGPVLCSQTIIWPPGGVWKSRKWYNGLWIWKTQEILHPAFIFESITYLYDQSIKAEWEGSLLPPLSISHPALLPRGPWSHCECPPRLRERIPANKCFPVLEAYSDSLLHLAVSFKNQLLNIFSWFLESCLILLNSSIIFHYISLLKLFHQSFIDEGWGCS